jgi:predicted O-methyltransferase YrrM
MGTSCASFTRVNPQHLLTVSHALRNVAYYSSVGIVRDRVEAVRFWSRLLATAGKWRDSARPSAGLPPRSALDLLYPNIDAEAVYLERGQVQNGEVTTTELLAVTAIARKVAPRRVFEFGTFMGSTTLHLARACPEAEIFTLDLPNTDALSVPLERGDAVLNEWSTSNQDSRRFRGRPEAERVHELYGDSLTFDFSPYKASMDLVFVDAAHDPVHAAADTRNALFMLAPRGVVLWHDYLRAPGVTAAVAEVARTCGDDYEVVEIERTCVAVMKPRNV